MKRYSAYKDSGVDWLGSIPINWSLKRLKYLFSFISGGTPPTEQSIYWDGLIPWVSPKDMRNGLISDSIDHISEKALSDGKTNLIPAESVLLVVRSGILRHKIPIAVNLKPVSINQDLKGIVPKNEKMASRFFQQFVCGRQNDLLAKWKKQGATVESLELEDITNTSIPMPDEAEQFKIIAYLNHKTHLIDTLIEKKQKQIELLQEQRAAIINQTVTKGLNPDAKMKDSGIEWLGDVPEHWEIIPFKYIAQIAEGQVDPKDGDFKNSILIAPNHIESGTGRLLLKETADEQGAISGKYKVKNGDIVYSKIRPALNKLCLADEDCLCSADMYPIQTQPGMNSKFLFYYMLSETFVRLMINESMRVAMPKINRDTLRNYMIPMPPIDEQSQISDILDSEFIRISHLIEKLRFTIDFLKEYRTTLISEVVTGKIDVRDEAIPA